MIYVSVEGNRLPSTISDLLEEPNNTSPCKTVALARRFQRLADEHPEESVAYQARKAALRLSRCARAGRVRGPWRCGAVFCARCSAQVAKRYLRRLTQRMRDIHRTGRARDGFALLTFTVAADSLAAGVQTLSKARAAFFRKRLITDSIAGGEGHVQVEPARGAGARRWNCHAHALIQLARPLADIDLAGLRAAWRETLHTFGAQGSVDLRQQENLLRLPFRRRAGVVSPCPALRFSSETRQVDGGR